MKILNVIASMAPESGGPCQGLRNSIPELKKLDCQNLVLCLDDPSASFLGMDPFPVVALGPAKNPWSYRPKLLPWLIENLPQFDVVIIHGLWLYHGYAVHKALRIIKSKIQNSATRPGVAAGEDGFKIPRYFVMSHGMLDPYFQRDPSRWLKAIRNWFYWKLIEGKVVNGADGILFTCEEELLLARQTFRPYHPQRELNVGYGVAEPPARTPAMAEAFSAACPGLDQQPYLLFISRIHPKKGVDLLIRAYADLVQKSKIINHQSSIPSDSHPLPHLVIAGPLDSAYAKEMQKLAEKLLPSSADNGPPTTDNSPLPPPAPLGISATVTDAPLHPPTTNRPPISSTDNRQQTTDNSPLPPTDNRQRTTDNRPPVIHFPGMLSGGAKWGAFHGCGAFVLTSHQENFGIAVAEALACGKPVLISKRVNIWREILSNEAGLVANDDLEGARDLIARWLAISLSRRRGMEDQAVICYRKHFAIETAAQKMCENLMHVVMS